MIMTWVCSFMPALFCRKYNLFPCASLPLSPNIHLPD